MTTPAISKIGTTVAKLSREIARADEIRQALQYQDDPQLILDMIEGETDLHEVCAVLYEETITDIALLAGLKEVLANLGERKSRIEKSIETKRGLILMAMQRADIPTIRTPLATLSVKKTAAVAIITDEAAIPSQFWKPQDPKLDKSALTDALKGGQDVAGATLSNGGISLQIRSH